MKCRRHIPEQIIRKLREAERLLGEGKTRSRRSSRPWRSASRPFIAGATSTAG
jgi:hypothetical protein